MAKVVGHIQAKAPEPRFRAIDEELEARKFLEEAEITRSVVDVQFASIPFRFTGKICDPTNPSIVTVMLPSNIDPTWRETLGTGLLERDCMLVVFIRGLTLLGIRATRAEILENKIQLAPPWRLFAIQRRKEARFEIPLGYDLNIRIDAIEGSSRKVEKKLLDVSASGLGFQVISSREAGLFRAGVILKNVLFRIDNRVITADLKVRSHCPIPADRKASGVKVGCSFAQISPGDAEFLSAWVSSRTVTF